VSAAPGVVVAVVDSGINPTHPHVGGVSAGIAFGPDGASHDDWVDRLGHGTAVAAAIREKAPRAELIAVRVFERALATTLTALLGAIDWALGRGARVINLSLGTPNAAHAPALRAALERARSLGAFVVSPAEHQGAPAYPGVLGGAVGVVLDWECPREGVDCRALPDGRVVVAASGYPRPIPGVPPEQNLSGISFAVANASGVIARVLEQRPEVRETGRLLRLLGPG
jgi:subtilisin family serine protease